MSEDFVDMISTWLWGMTQDMPISNVTDAPFEDANDLLQLPAAYESKPVKEYDAMMPFVVPTLIAEDTPTEYSMSIDADLPPSLCMLSDSPDGAPEMLLPSSNASEKSLETSCSSSLSSPGEPHNHLAALARRVATSDMYPWSADAEVPPLEDMMTEGLKNQEDSRMLCRFCATQFSEAAIFIKHLREEHKSELQSAFEPGKCYFPECNNQREKWTLYYITRHLEGHFSISQFACPTCHETFTQKKNLQYHTQQRHCAQCGQKYHCIKFVHKTVCPGRSKVRVGRQDRKKPR